MKILIEKYSWSNDVEIDKVNFFSDSANTLVETIPIHDDDINISFIEKSSFGDVIYEFTDIDANNALYFKASGLQFRLFNDSSLDLDSFFEIYNTIGFFKFKLYIYDSGELIYLAVINRNDVKYSSRKSNILDIDCIGLEKEFSEYNSSVKIVHPDVITNFNVLNLSGLNFKRIQNVLISNFGETIFDFTNDTFLYSQKIYIADKPYIYSPLSQMSKNDLFECKSGYINFYNAGMTRMEYLNYLCFSLGWQWYFNIDKIVIRPAFNNITNEYVINYNDTFIEHSIENTKLDFTKENIKISCGEYYSANSVSPQSPLRIQRTVNNANSTYTGGGTDILFSLKKSDINLIRPFKKLGLVHNGSNYFYWVGYDGTFQRVNEETESNYNYEQLYVTVNPNNSALYDISLSNISYSADNTVVIKTGVTNRENGAYLGMNNARSNSGRYYGSGNSLSTSNSITWDEIGYTGSVGESMIFYDSSINKYNTYENYMKREDVKRNFVSFVTNNIYVTMSLKVYGLITNPEIHIKLINYPYANINNISMSVSSLSYNIFTKLVNLNVQFVNE